MISVRVRWSEGWSCHSMPNPAATGANASRRAAPSSTGVTASPEGATSTRMKNRPVEASPYWWLSAMLPPAARTAPATAWTMPVRSGTRA